MVEQLIAAPAGPYSKVGAIARPVTLAKIVNEI